MDTDPIDLGKLERDYMDADTAPHCQVDHEGLAALIAEVQTMVLLREFQK